MTKSDFDQLIARTKLHEGLVLKVYDDDSGNLLRPGRVCKGHPTIGYGRALDVKGISVQEAENFLMSDIAEFSSAALLRFPWMADLDPVRRGVLIEMCYQMGVGGVAGFKHTLGFIRDARFDKAAITMLQSKWARDDSPMRARKLAGIMEKGTYNASPKIDL